MESTHRRVEEWSIRYHQLVAEKLKAQPERVLAKARANLARLRRQHPNSEPYMARWQALLEGPLDELLNVMVSPGEDARALRQCTPFAGVVPPRERSAAFREFAREWRRSRAAR
ncbi:hypothetical protein [Caldinitratiruptor microaerophilus]|uniref:Uncharacterized protein n=1 Tax=Caldinitratiruptor microaerophilus TaxID=671077 RepID=A0AA35CMB5_9FIRM|nr:hypothetical protein [Caldinitratiruptor microaerophilus]BDG61013.1 hypothetical protein caldi_21030 [Caldinitratiruptor microaerophilus]